jgi:UDP-N-acetylglucosamine acyltransferase
MVTPAPENGQVVGTIHETAIIDERATIDSNVTIGPYSVVGPDVVLEEGCRLESHVVIGGNTMLGPRNHIFPFASIGLQPQDLKYRGEKSSLEIGAENVIREHVTLNPGTEGGGMLTEIGDKCLLMVGAHVAHDCRVGNNVILANNATLAGHVTVGDFAIVGGLSAIHQFVRIGKHSMIGGMSGIENDVIPYGSAMGNRAHLSGLNVVGLKRRNFSRETIHEMRKAYRLLFAEEGTMTERMDDALESFGAVEPVMDIIQFIQSGADTSRAICRPKFNRAA